MGTSLCVFVCNYAEHVLLRNLICVKKIVCNLMYTQLPRHLYPQSLWLQQLDNSSMLGSDLSAQENTYISTREKFTIFVYIYPVFIFAKQCHGLFGLALNIVRPPLIISH